MILLYLFVDLSCPAKQVVLWWLKVFCFLRTSCLWSSGDCRNMPPSSPQRIGAAPPAEQSVPVIRTALKVTNGNKCWWRIMNSDECWWRHNDDLTVTWLKWPAFVVLQYISWFFVNCNTQFWILSMLVTFCHCLCYLFLLSLGFQFVPFLEICQFWWPRWKSQPQTGQHRRNLPPSSPQRISASVPAESPPRPMESESLEPVVRTVVIGVWNCVHLS